MQFRTATMLLSRRLVERYLMFGLACLFVCISLTATLAYQGRLTELIPVTALLPLALLMIGAVVLRRTVRLNEAIEQQLLKIASVSSVVDSVLHPLADPSPAAIGWNTILSRLTDAQTTSTLESRLSESLSSVDDKLWTAVFNMLSEGIAVCDGHGCVIQANNAFAAMVGQQSAAQVVGQQLGQLVCQSCGNTAATAREELSRNAGTCAFDLSRGAELAAGVWRISRRPLIGDPIHPGHLLWIIRDITQQKLADEMRNQFVFTATHELRTPLANIKAYAETLSDAQDIDPEQQKGFYNIINAEVTRLARFVDELLNISQMEAGAVTIRRHETDIERLLAEVIEYVQPQVKQKGLDFQVHLPPKMGKLHVDKDKLAASLVNLLGNAVKYTPEGGNVRLFVETEETEIHFHIEDSGIGVATEELPRICEKFFRSSDARVRKITGSGLGLAFSQEVARLHGGRITIKSEIDKGSRFTLTLPLK